MNFVSITPSHIFVRFRMMRYEQFVACQMFVSSNPAIRMLPP